MIRINLIPYREARRRAQSHQHAAIFAAVLAVAVVLVVGVHQFTGAQLDQLKTETLALQRQNIALKHKIGRISDLDDKRAEVRRKLAVIDQLQDGRFDTLETLHAIAATIPNNVWLKSVEYRDQKVRLVGWGESNKAVARFMRQLDHSPQFNDVRLGEIRRVLMAGLPMRHFTLHLTRTTTASRQPANAAPKKAQ